MRRLLITVLLLGCSETGPPLPEPAPTPPPPADLAPEPNPAASSHALEDFLSAARADARSAGLRPYLALTHTDDDGPTYETLAAFLNAHPRLSRVRIAVHTNPRGSAEWNQALSQQRADVVAAALVSRGIDCHRVEPVGYGETIPINGAPMVASRRTELWFIRVDDVDVNEPDVNEPAADACPREG